MSSSKSRYSVSKLRTLKVQAEFKLHAKAVNALAFSPDGKLLASADDEGLIAIQETKTDTCIRMYKAAKPVLKLAWDPANPSLLCAGCTNGEILKLKIDKKGEDKDIISIEKVMGWIHAMSISKLGGRIAIACGNRVEVIRQESLQEGWGPASLLPIPKIEDGIHPLIRDVHIVGDLILVSFFFAELGVVAYSAKKPHRRQWRLPKVKQRNYIAGSAVSPSEKRFAVANMFNGVDIYNLEEQSLESNIIYDIGGYRYVDVVFIDDQTIVIGHPEGAIVLATLAKVSQKVHNVTVLKELDPVPTVAAAIIRGRLRIVAGSTENLEPAKVVSVNEPEKRKSTMKHIGCCCIRTVVGLTAITILFVIFVPTEEISQARANLEIASGGNRTPPVVTAGNIPLGPAKYIQVASHKKLPGLAENKVAITSTTVYKPLFRIDTTIARPTRTAAVIKSVAPIDSAITPTTLVHAAVKPLNHAEMPITETVTSVHAIFVTVTETQSATASETVVITVMREAPAITHTEHLAATHTYIITETITARPTDLLFIWFGIDSAKFLLFLHVGVLLSLVVVVHIGRNGSGPGDALREAVHRCAAVDELEKIRQFTTNAAENEHQQSPDMASQGERDAGVDPETTDVAEGPKEEDAKGLADVTEDHPGSTDEESAAGGESPAEETEDEGKARDTGEEEANATDESEEEASADATKNRPEPASEGSATDGASSVEEPVIDASEDDKDVEGMEKEGEVGNAEEGAKGVQEEAGSAAQEGERDIPEEAVNTQSTAVDATDDAVEQEQSGDEDEDTITASGNPVGEKKPNNPAEGHQQPGSTIPPTQGRGRGASKAATGTRPAWGKPVTPKPTVPEPLKRPTRTGTAQGKK